MLTAVQERGDAEQHGIGHTVGTIASTVKGTAGQTSSPRT